MKTIFVTLISTGIKMEIAANVIGPLAVHRNILPNGSFSPDCWAVSHIGSGGLVGQTLRKKAALAMAKDLKDCPEWADVCYPLTKKARKALERLRPLRDKAVTKYKYQL